MDEKQKQAISKIQEVLKSNAEVVSELKCVNDDLTKALQILTKDLKVIDVISGHNDVMFAASALCGIREQINHLLNGLA